MLIHVQKVKLSLMELFSFSDSQIRSLLQDIFVLFVAVLRTLVLLMRSVSFDRFPSVLCFSYVSSFLCPLTRFLFHCAFTNRIVYPVLAHAVGTSISLMISVPNSYLTVSILGILPREL